MESLIKAVKIALKDVLFKRDFTDEELQTALVSVAGMIDQQPLSYVSSENEDYILTPAHFLLGSLRGT